MLTLLLGLIHCVVELLDRLNLGAVERALPHAAPHRRRIQRVFDSASVHCQGVFSRTNFVPDSRARRWRSQSRILEIRPSALLSANTDVSITRLNHNRAIIAGQIADSRTVRVSLTNRNH